VITCDHCRDILSLDHTAIDEAVHEHLFVCPPCSAYLDAIIQLDVHGPSVTRYSVSDSLSQRMLQSIDDYVSTSELVDDHHSRLRVSLILGVTALVCGICMAALYNITGFTSFITPLHETLSVIRFTERISEYYMQISDFMPIMEILHTQTVWMVILITFWLIIVNNRNTYLSTNHHDISSQSTY